MFVNCVVVVVVGVVVVIVAVVAVAGVFVVSFALTTERHKHWFLRGDLFTACCLWWLLVLLLVMVLFLVFLLRLPFTPTGSSHPKKNIPTAEQTIRRQ